MTPETNDVLGINAGVLAAAWGLQRAKTWKTRSAGGFLVTMYAMLCTRFLLWLTCGIMTENIPTILSNGVSPAFYSVLLACWFRFGGASGA